MSDNATDSIDESVRKIFVGGLSWQTTEDGLKHFFESKGFGVESVIIMRDKITFRSRGFGFVTFEKKEHVDKSVNSDLLLDGRKIEAKAAVPKKDMDNNSKKIFVGGIPIHLGENEFRKYFEKFGKVAEAQVMVERQTNRSRGFGFITFLEESVTKAVLKETHIINGKQVEVKKAEPKRDRRQIHYVPFPVPYFSPYPYPGPIYGPPGMMYGAPFPYDPTYFMPPYNPQFMNPFEEYYSQSPILQRNSNGRKNSKGSDAPSVSSPKRRHSHIPSRSIPFVCVTPPKNASSGVSQHLSESSPRSTMDDNPRRKRVLSQPVSIKKGTSHGTRSSDSRWQ